MVFGDVETYPGYQHDISLMDVLLENRQGNFVEVSADVGVTLAEHSNAVATADVDNNGYADLIISNRGLLTHKNEASIWLNIAGKNGKRHFKLSTHHGVVSTELGASGLGIDTFDYDLDGDVDIVIGNERGKWHLFNNQQSQGNFIIAELPIIHSSGKAVNGALVKISACDKTQQQRVGATGAMYSSTFNNFIHFGLGDCKQPVDVKVVWSNGSESTQRSPVNTRIKVH